MGSSGVISPQMALLLACDAMRIASGLHSCDGQRLKHMCQHVYVIRRSGCLPAPYV